MKRVVLITGTNGVGKSTMAREIIKRGGGVAYERDDATYLKNARYALAGRYKGTTFGGVDNITNEKGSSCTSRLAEVVKTALQNVDIVFCEGSYLNTFGLNLTNALFLAEKQLVVSLYAPPTVILQRIIERSGTRKRNWREILSTQKQAMVAAQKWQSIGVKVLQINTAEVSVEDGADMIIKEIEYED